MIFPVAKQEQRLKWAFESCKNGAWGSEPDGEDDVVCIRAADFDGQSGRLTDGERTLRSVDPSTFEKVALRPGDLVMEKSGGGEKQLVGRTVLFSDERPSVCSNFLARCRPAGGVEPAYLNYLMLAIYAGRGTYPHIKQSTGIQNLDLGSYLDTRVAVPSLPMQQRIARFLDEKTARIDALIEKKQALLARLAEKRQALITRAVTKGLNPDVPMKPSGVDWLGDIPAHWGFLRLKNLARGIVDAEHKTALESDAGDYLIVRTANVRDGELMLEGAKYADQETYLEWTKRALPEAGDVLMTREAPAGEVCLVPANPRMLLGQRMVLIKLMSEIVDAEFFVFMLSGVLKEFISVNSQGSTLPHFNMSDIGRVPVVLPTLQEQQKITLSIRKELEGGDTLRGRIDTSMGLLVELRSTLITAAVTGQLPELNG